MVPPQSRLGELTAFSQTSCSWILKVLLLRGKKKRNEKKSGAGKGRREKLTGKEGEGVLQFTFLATPLYMACVFTHVT